MQDDSARAASEGFQLRPIRPDDLDRLRAFVRHLSPRTGYQRLLSPRTPTEEELRRWSSLDPAREAALVATVGADCDEQIVGVARYVREGDAGEAEFAIVLADAWQGRGHGTGLLRALIEQARNAGVPSIHGTTLTTNAAALALARRVGFRTRRDPASAVLTLLELDLSASRVAAGPGRPGARAGARSPDPSPSRTACAAPAS